MRLAMIVSVMLNLLFCNEEVAKKTIEPEKKTVKTSFSPVWVERKNYDEAFLLDFLETLESKNLEKILSSIGEEFYYNPHDYVDEKLFIKRTIQKEFIFKKGRLFNIFYNNGLLPGNRNGGTTSLYREIQNSNMVYYLKNLREFKEVDVDEGRITIESSLSNNCFFMGFDCYKNKTCKFTFLTLYNKSDHNASKITPCLTSFDSDEIQSMKLVKKYTKREF